MRPGYGACAAWDTFGCWYGVAVCGWVAVAADKLGFESSSCDRGMLLNSPVTTTLWGFLRLKDYSQRTLPRG